MSQEIIVGQKLFVDIVRATGLAQLNHFTGDHPYVQCEVKHLDRHEGTTKAATKPVTMGDTMNPFWNERLEIQPWQPGEDLEFTVYDKGLIGARTEGKASLPCANFYPQGYSGMIPISGLPNAFLQIAVQPAGGAPSSTYGVSAGVTYAAAPASPGVTYSMPAASSGMAYSTPAAYSTGTTAPMTYSAGTTAAAAPVTMMAPTTYTQGSVMPMQTAPTYTQSSAVPMQTYSGAANTYSTSTPMMSGTTAMPIQTQTYSAAPMPTYVSPSPTYMQQPQTYMVQGGQVYGGGAYGTGAYKLAVSIIQAQGLKHMNHFTGDHPYVVCEVKHAAHRERRTKVETKPVTSGDTLNPYWNETHELEPWHPGEPVEFTVYDKGLIGSKTEGKATLPGELFSGPNGWTGTLPIGGLSHALLYVAVRVLGPSSITVEANSGLFAPTASTTEQPVVEQQVVTQEGFVETQTVPSKKRSKKLKVGSKKKSGCC